MQTNRKPYTTQIEDQPAVWLQYVGYCKAKPVEDLKPGEECVYNFGTTSEIVSVEPVGKMIALAVRTEKGELWTKKHRRGTLIAYAD